MRKIRNPNTGSEYCYITVSLRGNSDLIEKVEEYKKRLECSESHLLRRALREFFDRQEQK